MMAIVLCGGIVVGFQKKFPFQYQSVYSKVIGGSNNKNKIEIAQYMKSSDQERDLDVGTSSPSKATNSAEAFLHSVFKSLGTPSFMFEKNIQNLKGDHISTIDQLREFDERDWKRYGFKKKQIIVIRNKLQQSETNDDDEEEDEEEEELTE